MASHVSQPPDFPAEIPMRRPIGSARLVPDFAAIPREHWERVMATVPMRLRVAAAQCFALPADAQMELIELATSAAVPPARSDRARQAIAADPRLEAVPYRRRGRIADRQVNFRITDEEYLDLATAAELAGTSPSRLAALLVSNGVQRVIYEANRSDG